jgi:hypothetical protein
LKGAQLDWDAGVSFDDKELALACYGLISHAIRHAEHYNSVSLLNNY